MNKKSPQTILLTKKGFFIIIILLVWKWVRSLLLDMSLYFIRKAFKAKNTQTLVEMLAAFDGFFQFAVILFWHNLLVELTHSLQL